MYIHSGSLSFKLAFHCSKNEAEYKVLIIGRIFILQMGICRFYVQGDPELIIKQVDEESVLKEIALVSYCCPEVKIFMEFQF